MDIDKLVKGVQIIVKQEMKEERKKLSKVIKEVVSREVKPLKEENKKLKKKIKLLEQQEVQNIQERPVQESTFMDDDFVNKTEVNNGQPTFSSNPVINQVLAETAKNYNPKKDNSPIQPQQTTQDPQMLNEVSSNEEGMEEYPTMNHNLKPQPNGIGMSEGGAEQVKQNLRAKMEAEFRQNGGVDVPSGRPNPNGLGVKTGLEGLDRVLNRDNSELVKKMEQSKKEPFRPGANKSGW